MPFDYEKYGFTKDDLYGQTLRLAGMIYDSQDGIRQVTQEDHQIFCDHYVRKYKLCLDRHSLLDADCDIDSGAWIPLEEYRLSDKTVPFEEFYADYISIKFNFVRPFEEVEMDDEGPERDSITVASSDSGMEVDINHGDESPNVSQTGAFSSLRSLLRNNFFPSASRAGERPNAGSTHFVNHK